MYTWKYPIKRNFRFGIIGKASTGKRYFQTGKDEQTAITWGNAVEPCGNGLSLPVTFSRLSGGLALMTTAWAKSSVLLPNGKEVKKRYKALTMVSLSYVYLVDFKYPNSIRVKSAGGKRDCFPTITDVQNWG